MYASNVGRSHSVEPNVLVTSRLTSHSPLRLLAAASKLVTPVGISLTRRPINLPINTRLDLSKQQIRGASSDPADQNAMVIPIYVAPLIPQLYPDLLHLSIILSSLPDGSSAV